jgi:hypothetical protein
VDLIIIVVGAGFFSFEIKQIADLLFFFIIGACACITITDAVEFTAKLPVTALLSLVFWRCLKF